MTNNVKTTKQTKKNPLDVEAGKYRLWEKLRRDRFNAGLESLSASLPDYEAGVSKWTKGDIVERALNYIKALQAQRIPDDLQRRIKGLKRQNSKLREIIRSKLTREMDPKEFSKLNLQEIQSLISKLETEAANNKENAPSKPGGEDHSYSLCSQDTPEEPADLEVSSEEVIIEEASTPASTTAKSSSPTVVAAASAALTLKPLTLFSTPGGTLLNPGTAATSWPQHSLIAIDPNQILSSVPIVMRPLIKLPLPRLPPKNTTVKSPTTTTNKKVLGEEKKDRDKEEKTKKDESAKQQVNLPSTNLDEFDLKASSTLPDAILASEDPLTQEMDVSPPDTEDSSSTGKEEKSSKETPEKKSDETPKSDTAKQVDPSKPLVPKEIPKVPQSGSRLLSSGGDKGGGKKSKSSYSIAALCQISVNIGGDALVASENCMVNSPGVVSLNSVGTASPSVTPAPSSPPALTPPIEKKDADKVIQELKPVPPSVIKQAIQSKEATSLSSHLEKPKASFVNEKDENAKKPPKEVLEAPKSTPSIRKEEIIGKEYSKCVTGEKSSGKKEGSSSASLQSKSSSSKQWPVLQHPGHYGQMPPAPKDVSKEPSSSSSQKDLGGKNSGHQYSTSSKVQSSQQLQQVVQVQQYQGGYPQSSSIAGPPLQQQQQQHAQQVQQQSHISSQQHHEQQFLYNNASSTTILNEFLGHPLQTAPLSSSLGGATTTSQFHQGAEANNHIRYNYNYQNGGHHISSASSSDYHGSGSSSSNNNQVNNSHHEQYFPSYNRSYYAQNIAYELPGSTSKPLQAQQQQQQLKGMTSQQQQQLHLQQQVQLQGPMMQQPFSVNQLVSSSSSSNSNKNTAQRKGGKRPSVSASTTTNSAYELPPAKKPNRNPTSNSSNSSSEKDSSSRLKEDKKGGSSSKGTNSRSSKPSSSSLLRKGSYSAESLIMDPSQYSAAHLDYQQQTQQQQQQQHLLQGSKAKMDFGSGWTPTNGSGSSSSSSMMIAPSVDGVSQFCSMSPSPFTQDLEFTMFISGNDAAAYGAASQANKLNNNNNGGFKQQQANNNSSNKMAQNGFDNSNNLFPLPTLTPPSAVEDPYAGFMNPSQHHHYHQHTPSGYNSSSTGGNKQNNSNNYNKHFTSSAGRFNANSSSDYSSLNTSNSASTSVGVPVPTSSSSLVNFNLSTIFPEINEKFSSSGGAPLVPTTSAASTTSSQTTSTSKAAAPSGSDFRQNLTSTSDVLPHSIAMLGNTGQQAGVSSMVSGFNGPSSLSGLHYHHHQQQQQSQ